MILTCSEQYITNMWKLKVTLWTYELLRVLSLKWVGDGYPPTLESPTGARFFKAIPCHASQTIGVTEICAREVFFLSLLQSNMKSCAIFERHQWSILLISILFILMMAPSHIFTFYIHPWARVVFHVQLHQLVRYTYQTRSFYRWTFNITSVMRFLGLPTYICVS